MREAERKKPSQRGGRAETGSKCQNKAGPQLRDLPHHSKQKDRCAGISSWTSNPDQLSKLHTGATFSKFHKCYLDVSLTTSLYGEYYHPYIIGQAEGEEAAHSHQVSSWQRHNSHQASSGSRLSHFTTRLALSAQHMLPATSTLSCPTLPDGLVRPG